MEQFAQQLLNGVALGAAYAVVALGFGLVFSVLRVINLAHPAFFTLGAYVAVVSSGAANGLPFRPWSSIALVLVAGLVLAALAGLIVERTVVRPLRSRYMMVTFIATSGVTIIVENILERVFGPDPVPIAPVLPTEAMNIAGLIVTPTQVLVILSSLVVVLVVSTYVRRTRLGLATRAVAERSQMASASGVNVNRVYQITMALAAATAGVAGVSIGLMQTQAAPGMGLIFGTKSFVCMLVAGNKNIEGIIVIGIGLGILEAMVAGYLSSNFRDAIAFALLLGILFFRPSGLFGSYPESE